MVVLILGPFLSPQLTVTQKYIFAGYIYIYSTHGYRSKYESLKVF
jgi:hypothetical protein